MPGVSGQSFLWAVGRVAPSTAVASIFIWRGAPPAGMAI